jgi:hypothetical protein
VETEKGQLLRNYLVKQAEGDPEEPPKGTMYGIQPKWIQVQLGCMF